LISQGKLADSSADKFPAEILSLINLIETDQTVFQPVVTIIRTDLPNEPYYMIKVKKEAANKLRYSMGIYDYMDLKSDYKENLGKLKPNEYMTKEGTAKPQDYKPGETNVKIFHLTNSNEKINEGYFSKSELLVKYLKDQFNLNALNPEMKILIYLERTSGVISGSFPAGFTAQIDFDSASYEVLDKFFNSNPTISIDNKILMLQKLFDNPANQNDFRIYLDISRYWYHKGKTSGTISFYNESLNYLTKAKNYAVSSNKVMEFNQILKEMEKNFFNSWPNNSMTQQFQGISN
jgi:hypothetical protein